MAEQGQLSNFSQKNGKDILSLPSTIFLKRSEGMYVTYRYTSEIFTDPHSKKQVFIKQCLGFFLNELRLFCHFMALPSRYHARFQASSLTSLTWIAGIGLGMRL